MLARPALSVSGHPATLATLKGALSAMWLPGEVIVYIGCSGGPVSGRVRQFYATPLGARAPHAGGWPVQALEDRDNLFVHIARAERPLESERQVLDEFIRRVPNASRDSLCDPDLPLPFANLVLPGGRRKRHGIAGATQPHGQRVSSDSPRPEAPRQLATTDPLIGRFTLNVTAADIRTGQIRIGRAAKRGLGLPVEPRGIVIRVLGHLHDAVWDPRLGPDKERSGVLRIGRPGMEKLFPAPCQLEVGLDAAGLVRLTGLAHGE